MRNVDQADKYKTKDLYEASLLYSKRCRLIDLEREGNFYWFIFEDKSACQNLVDSYWQRELTINAKEFIDALRSLKDRIFSQGRR